jgi:hypothetical protein
MVKTFFEGIKDDIKDTIAPPQKALIVVDEASGETIDPDAIAPPGEPGSETEGFIRRGDDEPLRALPVEPLDPDTMDGSMDEAPPEADPIRAIPVEEDELIEGLDEEP